ncbi:MAG: hypothetical protein KAG94_02225 [Clostridiales bacterium]|nr:hypothetical protein [Clostridiales bacterium]
MKKKIVTILSSIVIIFVILLMLIIHLPRNIQRDFLGVQIKAGEKNDETFEYVLLHFDGRFQKAFLTQASFVGYVVLESNGDVAEGEVNIRFHPELGGYLVFYSTDSSVQNNIGSIFIDSNFKQVTITVAEPVEGNLSRIHWSSDDGLIICAPASTREEAIIMSNDLMKNYLENKMEPIK